MVLGAIATGLGAWNSFRKRGKSFCKVACQSGGINSNKYSFYNAGWESGEFSEVLNHSEGRHTL